MKYAVQLTSKDNLTIGPFDSYDLAVAWLIKSVFDHEPYAIIGIIEPRPDHTARVNRYATERQA